MKRLWLAAALLLTFAADAQINGGINGGVTQIVAGTNVTISPTAGIGAVTVNASGGGGTGANPSATIGLAAVNGSATTFLRSDGAPPLSQSITPTWTALHTWTFTGQTANTAVTAMLAQNTTLAATGAQQEMCWQITGQGWKTTATAASQETDWQVCNIPIQGTTNPTSQLVFSSQVNGGGYTPRLTLSSGGSAYNLIAGNAQVSGTLQVTGSSVNLLPGTVFIGTAAPGISSGFGTSPSVTHNNGPGSFSINVGTGGSATSGVVAMNTTASNAWACSAADTGATPTGQTEQTGTSTTTATFTNYSRTTGTAVAWTASEIIQITCFAN